MGSLIGVAICALCVGSLFGPWGYLVGALIGVAMFAA